MYCPSSSSDIMLLSGLNTISLSYMKVMVVSCTATLSTVIRLVLVIFIPSLLHVVRTETVVSTADISSTIQVRVNTVPEYSVVDEKLVGIRFTGDTNCPENVIFGRGTMRMKCNSIWKIDNCNNAHLLQ